MKKIAFAFLLLGAFASKAQEVKKDTVMASDIDKLKQSLNEHNEKFNGLDERLSEMSGDVSSIKKIKITGYVQAQYEMYDFWNAAGTQHGMNVTPGGTNQAPDFVTNSFYLRRARFKLTYEAAEGVKFVLQPNFDIDKVQIKDAYVQLNDRWMKTFSLWMGQFNRTTYEIEYSSRSREFAERSLMSRTLYPTERDQGAKLEANFNTKYNFPLKLQAAILNGNFGQGSTSNGVQNQLSYQYKDVDNRKDFMGRAVYSMKLPNQGLGIDFGAHTYLGANTVLTPSATATGPGAWTAIPTFTDVNGHNFTPKAGDKLARQLFGAEAQVYWDFLGGLSLKTEYIRGTYSGTTNPAQLNSLFNANKVRNVDGAYVSLVKNVGAKHQIGARWDMFDPNSKLSGNQITKADDLKYNNYTFSYQYFFDDNIKIQLTYNMPINEKSAGITKADGSLDLGSDFYNRDKRDNTFTIRLQAAF